MLMKKRFGASRRGIPLKQLSERQQTPVRTCRVCQCTDDDCSGCIARTGKACHWVEPDLCSACVTPAMAAAVG